MKKQFFNKLWQVVKLVVKKIGADNVFNLSASLAYYAVFSLAPLLFIIINTLGLFLDKNRLNDVIFDSLNELLGPTGAAQLRITLNNVGISDASAWKNILGVIILIFTASTIFVTVKNGLNYIFKIKTSRLSGILNLVQSRLVALSVIIGTAFILVVTLIINGVITFFFDSLVEQFSSFEVVLMIIGGNITPSLFSLMLFAFIFKILPDAKIKLKDAFVGALVTTILLSIGRYIISFYIASSDMVTVFDAAGSLIVILLWMFYASFIFYTGATFTYAYAEIIGNGISSEPYSTKYVEKNISDQETEDNV